ncbi:L-aspartate decarboxylase dtxS4 [Claviceps africana]|uniref:L-aspartate decarboxylase dtxS4 n=1 Tax=Claviceps africana TaxID=83212 RepID=A0A8K0NM28_9HYPO|nr:L-aspartate decarboxylase dtxS4 [Claviceps africana]
MSSKLVPAQVNGHAAVVKVGITDNTGNGLFAAENNIHDHKEARNQASVAVTEVSSLDRAGELEDLLEAVQALVVPFVRAADLEAAVKPSGHLRPGTQWTRTRQNVLVDEQSPQKVLESMQFSLPEGPGRGRQGLLDTIETVLRHSVNTWDQGFLDKLTASTNPVGVISEIVLGVLNTNVHVFHVSPALTVIEKVTARTLASYFGFKGPRAGGITCQGGSASNFTSLVIARNALYPESKVSGGAGHRFAIFTSLHGHFSVQKAAVAAGLGTSSIVCVPVDDKGRMLSSELRRLAAEAKAQQQLPLYVNATAGTTVLGAFDPIAELRDICDEFGMWLHVDGSWGGSTAFSSKHRYKLDGCGLADSLTITPQKMLNVPMTCSFLLTNDLKRFHDACSLRAEYLFHEDDGDEDDEVWDLADLTLQCGRRADSLKMALAWIYYGAAGFEKGIDHAFGMAAHLATLVQQSTDFELLSANPPPCLQVCFYYAPHGGQASDDKAENTKRTRIMARKMLGRGFMFDFAPGPRGDFFRVVINCQTLLGTVDGLFRALCEVGRELSS